MDLEHIHIWNFYFTNEIGTFSHMKYLNQMWNELVENFTCEILVYETSISRMKYNEN